MKDLLRDILSQINRDDLVFQPAADVLLPEREGQIFVKTEDGYVPILREDINVGMRLFGVVNTRGDLAAYEYGVVKERSEILSELDSTLVFHPRIRGIQLGGDDDYSSGISARYDRAFADA